MDPKEVAYDQTALTNSLTDNPVPGDPDTEGLKNSFTKSNQSHVDDDVDSSQVAHHHTIGLTQNQVSAGTHQHDGIDSRLVPMAVQTASDLSVLTGNFNALNTSFGTLNSNYNGHNHANLPVPIPDITNIARAGWVPTWTANPGPNPAIGNGTMVGDWIRFGPIIFLTLWWKAGSTTTFGTGFWQFTLPFTLTGVGSLNVMNGAVYNNAKRYPCDAILEAGKIDRIVVSDAKAGGTPLLGNAGWGSAWAVGDYFYINGWYWAV